MRIGVDAHALGSHAGGNETYVRELLHALSENPSSNHFVALVSPHLASEQADAANIPLHSLGISSSYLRVPFALPIAVHRLGLDVLHAQYIAPPYCPCPFVVSVHDIVWKHYPESLPAVDRHRLAWLMPNTIRRAARVFVLTHAMRNEIAEAYSLPLERFDVVQPPPDPLFRPIEDEACLAQTRRKYGIPSDYVLYVGALQPRKNVVRLAQAFARLADRGLTHSLVIVGKQAWLYEDMLTEIDALKLGERLIFTGYVDRQDLPCLLSGAGAFAYVSLYEGFGLPVLEALACHAPVLTSTDPAIREVAGNAAVFCDPLEVDAIEEGLSNILTDNGLRGELRSASRERCREFSRKAMAEAALLGYERAHS